MIKKVIFLISLSIIANAFAINSPIIQDVEYHNVGTGVIDTEYIKTYTTTKAGDEFDRVAVSRDLKALINTKLFSDVEVKTTPVGNEMILAFYFQNKYRLSTKPKIKGNKKFSTRKINRLLELNQQDLIDDQVMANLALKIEREYKKANYPDAKVRWDIKIVNEDEGTASVVIKIDEGKKEYVKYVYFKGNTAISDDELDKVIRFPVWWNPVDWFRKVTPGAIELDAYRQMIKEQFLNMGYLDISVSPALIGRTKKGELTVTYQIQEGNEYYFGDISLQGVTTFPLAAIEKNVLAVSGEPAAVNIAEQTQNNIQDYYGQRGYLNTIVRPLYIPSITNHVVDIQYKVQEGYLTKIHDIIIKGNVRTKDKVIRRELLVEPGDIYNTVRLRTSENRLRNLGFFDLIRSNPRVTDIPDEKDLVLEVREQKTGNIMLGAGFSSIDSLTGFIEFSQGNFDIFNWPRFTGGGQKLKVKLQLGTKRNEFNMSFVEPWFLDRKLSFGTDIFWLDYEYDEYSLERSGVAFSLSRPLFGPARISFSLGIQDEDISNTDKDEYWYVDDIESSYYFKDQDFFKTTLGVNILYDTRNHPFTPSRGDRIRLFAKYSGGIIGGDVDTYRLGLSYRKYIPLWAGHILALKLQGEVVDSFDGSNENIPLSDRLYIGGGRTIRGYKYRQVGPKVRRPQYDEATDIEPIGGCTFGLFSAEYIIPVTRGLSFAVFYDLGNVWYDPFKMTSDLASSTGCGLRLNMPGFPIRIDYAVPVKKDNELTEEETWNFWIGYDI
ncbi:MAG: outer membrane protein assembly factor BamA [Kiritimatiellae bacterium]|nr:outer membrane protein assembly factor BamA [Kiritimatiellia bacterium]